MPSMDDLQVGGSVLIPGAIKAKHGSRVEVAVADATADTGYRRIFVNHNTLYTAEQVGEWSDAYEREKEGGEHGGD